ncbi:hypothetical protein N7486_003962 [Penicillium sp. IBT 16267x]|nr:hypothetical protein N7486_003962 [Penicillium sp. IBT 16267x]
MSKWRCDRRQWELDLVTNEWKYGDLKRLSPKFDLVNLLDAKAFVMHQNDKDRAGEIDTFFTGRYRQNIHGKPVIANGDEGGHFTDSFLPLHNELNKAKMNALLQELQSLIDALQNQPPLTSNAMFATPTAPVAQEVSIQSNNKRAGDDLPAPNAKRITRSQTRDSRMIEAVYQSCPQLRPTAPSSASSHSPVASVTPTPAVTNSLFVSRPIMRGRSLLDSGKVDLAKCQPLQAETVLYVRQVAYIQLAVS